jgi:hypothetical protein
VAKNNGLSGNAVTLNVSNEEILVKGQMVFVLSRKRFQKCLVPSSVAGFRPLIRDSVIEDSVPPNCSRGCFD